MVLSPPVDPSWTDRFLSLFFLKSFGDRFVDFFFFRHHSVQGGSLNFWKLRQCFFLIVLLAVADYFVFFGEPPGPFFLSYLEPGFVVCLWRCLQGFVQPRSSAFELVATFDPSRCVSSLWFPRYCALFHPLYKKEAPVKSPTFDP